ENLIFVQSVGDGDLDGAIEGQLSRVDAFQHLHGSLNYVVATQQFAAKTGPRDLDLFGQGDFLLPREQRNFAHLGQVHADWVVGPRFMVFGNGQQEIVGVGFQLRIDFDSLSRDIVCQIVVNIDVLDFVC